MGGIAALQVDGRMSRSLTPKEVAFVRSLVLHEDDDIIAFAKPAGLSSQGGRIAASTLDDLLEAFARSNGKRPRLVHRLDRDTSGLIVAAKTKPAAAFLGKAMMGRRIAKIYHAIVGGGAPAPREGTIKAPLRRVEIGRDARMVAAEDGEADAQPATTGYRTLRSAEDAALVELAPRTGRMHQLRVHLAGVGRPILGDARYGGALVIRGRAVERLMLHAAVLRLPHPRGGELRLEAPPPRDFLELGERLFGRDHG